MDRNSIEPLGQSRQAIKDRGYSRRVHELIVKPATHVAAPKPSRQGRTDATPETGHRNESFVSAHDILLPQFRWPGPTRGSRATGIEKRVGCRLL